MKDWGVDASGLGRWSWYLLEGKENRRSRIVLAYAPCGSAASESTTYYQQQARYIKTKGLKTNSKEMFRKDLLRQLRKWRDKGDRLVLMMDATEDVRDRALCKQLTDTDIQMREAVHHATNARGPRTYFRGKLAIDGI